MMGLLGKEDGDFSLTTVKGPGREETGAHA